tara:strand:- start:1059 stop:1502 length:444 start_codon:yes stop_codon:yes gene_type:complete
MKQVYLPYWKWECYNSGMWNKVSLAQENEMLKLAIEFTGNHVLYGNSMKEVVYLWENTMVNNLTNLSINRKAFLGQCAVFLKHQIPEYIVRKAWKSLSIKQQILADNVAQQTIKEWELWYKRKLANTLSCGKKDVIKMGYQMRLHLN